MPWKYIRSSDEASVQNRTQSLARIAAWWDAFVAAVPDLERGAREGPPEPVRAWLDAQLAAVDPNLRGEVHVGEEGGYTLVVTPETHFHLRPMVQTLLQRAPDVTGWKVRGDRPALAAEAALARVKAETGHGLTMATALPQIGARHRVDLQFQMKLALTDGAAARVAAAALTRHLLGEDLYYQWVADIDVSEPIREAGWDRFLLPQRLRPVVMNLIESITKQLPDRPYYQIHTRELESIPYKLDPAPAEDYGGQDDLVVGTNYIPDFRRAINGKYPFFSSNYSRYGETFCYLKIDAGELSMDERLVRRQKWEERIHVPLRKSEAGRIVGSGTGLRYFYYEIAMTDLQKTVETIRKALLHKGLPDRSWLLFYDAELAGEYVGLRSGSPPPPAVASRQASSQPPAPPRSSEPSDESDWADATAMTDPLPAVEQPRE